MAHLVANSNVPHLPRFPRSQWRNKKLSHVTQPVDMILHFKVTGFVARKLNANSERDPLMFLFHTQLAGSVTGQW